MEVINGVTIEGNSYRGQIYGDNVTLTPGIVGKSLSVGQNNSYVNLGAIRDNCFGFPDRCTDGYTLALWIKRYFIGSNDNCYITNGGESYLSYGIAIFSRSSGALRIKIKTTTALWRLDVASPLDRWHHVVLTWSHVKDLSVYIDGQLAGTRSPIRYIKTPLISFKVSMTLYLVSQIRCGTNVLVNAS